MLIPICIFIIAIDHFKHKIEIIAKVSDIIFSKIISNQEKDNLSSASYFSIAALVIFIFFPKSMAINAFLILAISSSLATITGKSFKTRPFYEKSLGGSAAFFTSAYLITIIVGIIFNENILYYIFSLLAIYATTIVEARPKLLNLNENLTLPITYSLVMASFNMIWVYNY
jgi:dolichol kinase